mgnify:CR=1 FL=1
MKLLIPLTIIFSMAFLVMGVNKPAAGNGEMKQAGFNCNAIKKNESRTFQVSGKVTQSFLYCGGANPPRMVIEDLARPVAYPGKKFYIRAGSINNAKLKVVNGFTTDSAGSFSFRIAPGIYSIILEEQLVQPDVKKYEKQNLRLNRKCLDQWFIKPYYIIEVKDKDISDLNFHFLHRCFIDSDIPCISYDGPMPP